MTSDRNVSITFALQLAAGQAPPPDFAEFDGSLTFHFPGCHIYRVLDKDLRVISMSGSTRAIDIFRADDSIRIVGDWRDDPDNEYDGRTSFDRVHMLYLLNSIVEVIGWLTWSSANTIETVKVMAHTLDCDQEPGEGDIFGYNFGFDIIEIEKGEVPPVTP